MPRQPVWPPPVRHNKSRNSDYLRIKEGTRTRDVYLGPHGSEKARTEYLRIVRELEAHGGKLPLSASPTLIVAELLAAYCEHADAKYRKGGKPTGQMVRVRLALNVVQRLYGDKPLLEFGPVALETVRREMVKLGWTRGFVGSALGCVTRAWKWAVSRELLPQAKYDSLLTLEPLAAGPGIKETQEVQPVEDWVIEATLPHLGRIVADMVRLQRLTGMRSGELCSLRPCDVRRDGILPGLAVFEGTWIYTPEHHKTEEHAERVIFLGEKAQDVLAPYLLRDAELPCFSPKEAAEEWLLLNGRTLAFRRSRTPGNRYLVTSYGHAIRKGAERADAAAHEKQPDAPPEKRLVPHWHAHQLRHAAATAIALQYDLEHAGAVLGHLDLATTQRYVKTLRLAAKAMREAG